MEMGKNMLLVWGGGNGDEEKVIDRKGKHLLLHELFCVDTENVWTSISQMLPHYAYNLFFLTKQADFSCIVILLGKAQCWKYIPTSTLTCIFNIFVMKTNSRTFEL